ncbi:pyridoxamine 5'-phosphate oxidase family protein [Microbacterium sp. 10M-3C3]|jgi:general stress protein 26|uniref:pyridoxamine 5'-phosphate oxidase family protein n=1 Tax=Microbacterium sp. 10M-3C3 TaxID=2483401 RepID=UPI000F62C202|nr:pyridoxamine 5'-phosphate oxidase family protein [Microbacterium sp. 10M-3C3]
MADADELRKLAELLRKFRFAMLTTRSHGGELRAHPLTVQETEFDGDLWFVIGRHASAVEDVARDAAVGVSFSSSDAWLSITGTAQLVDDTAKLRELWGPGLEAWFPNGPEDPEVALLKVDASGAEYWDSPGGRIASAIAFVKHKVTGERYEGDNDKIDL